MLDRRKNMSGLKRWGAATLACGFVCVLLSSCDRAKTSVTQANKTLSGIKLSALPEGVTDIHCGSDGLFAKFVNVKFAASREQALAYLTANAVPYYSEFSATDEGYQVSATHALTTPSENLVVSVPAELELGIGMGQQKWFKGVYTIRHGWFYCLEKNPVLCQFYYDSDEGQFYIYWSHS